MTEFSIPGGWTGVLSDASEIVIRPIPTRTMQITHQYEYHKDTCESAAQVHLLDSAGVLWLTNIYTAKEYRGQHLTRPLIERAIADFGHRDIYLKTQPYADAPLDHA